MSTTLNMSECFFGPTLEPLAGTQVLSSHLQNATQTCKEFNSFLSSLKSINQKYHKSLIDLSSKSFPSLQSNDMISQLFKALLHNLVVYADTFLMENIPDLSSKVTQAQVLLDRKSQIESSFNTYKKQFHAVREAKQKYFNACQKVASPMEDSIQVDSTRIPKTELSELISAMKIEIQPTSVRVLLNVVTCVKEEDILNFIQGRKYPGKPFLDYLIANEYLLPVRSMSNSRYFQWNNTSSALEYEKSVRECEESRFKIESTVSDFSVRFQHWEQDRQSSTKEILTSILSHFSNQRQTLSQSITSTALLLESLDPVKQIEQIVERDKTGYARLKPTIYHDFYSGKRGLFGLELQEIAQRDGKRVPLFISKVLLYIENAGTTLTAQQGSNVFDLWYMITFRPRIEPIVNWNGIHSLIQELNEATSLKSVLKRYPLAIVVSTFKVYLQELPTSVICNEVYETVKMLYLSKTELDAKTRNASVVSLLSTMPSSHYHSLSLIIYYFHRLVQGDTEKCRVLAGVMGRILIRPDVETKNSLFDKHPERLLRDLIHFARDLVKEPSSMIKNSKHSLLAEEDSSGDDTEGFSRDVSVREGLSVYVDGEKDEAGGAQLADHELQIYSIE